MSKLAGKQKPPLYVVAITTRRVSFCFSSVYLSYTGPKSCQRRRTTHDWTYTGRLMKLCHDDVLCLLWCGVSEDAAELEPAWKGAGQEAGLQIWRIVVSRTHSPSSCALLGGFAIGTRVALLWQHYGNACQTEPSGNPPGPPHAARMPHTHTTHAGEDSPRRR